MPPKRKQPAAKKQKAKAEDTPQIASSSSEEPDEQYIYRVYRDIDDPEHGNTETDTLVGTYGTLEEANDAARNNLLAEWDLDDFESFEEEIDEYGLVMIRGEFSEGESVDARVVRVEVEKEDGADTVYMVNRNWNAEEAQFGEKEILGIYKSLPGANVRAKAEAKKLKGALEKKVELRKEKSGALWAFIENDDGEKDVLVEITEFKLKP